MKIEVDIPDGAECGGCPLLCESFYCQHPDVMSSIYDGELVGDKHPDCPSLKIQMRGGKQCIV